MYKMLLTRDVFITITGQQEGLEQAKYIMANIVKSNMHKLNLVSLPASAKSKKEAGISESVS